jgi:transposase-like protein
VLHPAGESVSGSAPQFARVPAMRPLALTEDQVTGIITAYKGGATRVDLAEIYGVHPNTITRALRKSADPLRRNRAHALTADQERQVVRSYLEGVSAQAIARRFQVSESYVSRVAIQGGALRRRPNLPGRRRRISDEEAVARGYREGATIRDLALVHGVSPATIRRALVRSRVERRAPHRSTPTPASAE